MFHASPFLAGVALAALMLTSTMSYADQYYTYPNRDYTTRKAIKQACKREIREQIRADKRHVEKIRFSSDSFDMRNLSNGRTRTRGQGQLLTGRGYWVDFDFKCVYDNYTSRVIRASYHKTSDKDERPDYDRDTRQACSREINRKVLRNHGSATHIRFDDRSLRGWRESRAETGLSGHGRFVGGRGKARHFEFSCIYNHRQGYTRNVWVSVH
jgi:ADP-ribose pyrophosphatase YjhB (NUDIX family)